MCVHATNKKPVLEGITHWEGKGSKSKKTEIYNEISTQRRSQLQFALRFEIFDLPPYGKESSCNSKSVLKGYVSTKTGYRLPNVHTFWYNQVHIVVCGAMGDVSSASNDSIFPLHHFYVDRIYEKWLRKFNNSPIGHNKDDVIVPLYPVYTHQYTMSTRMVSARKDSTWPYFTSSFTLNAI